MRTSLGAPPDEGAETSGGWFGRALIAYAVIEFIAIVLALYYY